MPNAQSFNPMDPDFKANPYSYYDTLRTEAPMHFFPPLNIWFLTRYDDCAAALKNPRLSSGIPRTAMGKPADLPADLEPLFGALVQNEMAWMMSKDSQEHTRMRNLVHKAFTPRMIENLRGRIQQITDDLLDQMQGAKETNFIDAFAFPLPVTVIAEMLGVPAADRQMFRHWSDHIVKAADFNVPVDEYKISLNAVKEFSDYAGKMIDERRKKPADDLVGILVAAEDEGHKLTHEEVIANMILLLIAGFETTVNLLGNTMFNLFRNPAEFQKLKSDLSLIKPAIEESLRYESPVQMIVRLAVEDFEFNGNAVKKGQVVANILGAANRDPSHFANPANFDITRADNDHIAFGNGVHFCLGAPLARLEGEIALGSILKRMPNIRQANGEVIQRDTFVFRGLTSLPVTL